MMRLTFSRCFALLLVLVSACFCADAQTYTESVLYNFCSQGSSACTDGSSPKSTLMQASDGNYYGFTQDGGSDDGGVIFKISPSGAYSVVYSGFCDLSSCSGFTPEFGTLIEGPDGNLYGTVPGGGANEDGTVFKMTPSGTLTVIYNFCSLANCADGNEPEGGVILGTDGNFYGTTFIGGTPNVANASTCPNGCGTVYKLTPSGTLTTIYSFCSLADCADGSSPEAGLVQGSDGQLYGTAALYGMWGGGVAYKVTTTGAYTQLYSFCNPNTASFCADGETPEAWLVEGSNGYFYGTTTGGGVNDYGAAFAVPASGTTNPLTALWSFCSVTSDCSDGLFPYSGMIVGSDGNLYGTTQGGDDNDFANSGGGIVYQLTPSGVETPIYWFCTLTDCTDGDAALGGVFQGSDGNFYGATDEGGSHFDGAIYKVAVSPALAAPVQLSLSSSSVAVGTPVTLSWKVLNAFSDTMQLCYAYVQGGATGAGTWTGQQTGTFSSTTLLYTGSASITPTASGTYTYALTCGGTESGFATLTVTGTSKLTPTATLTLTPTGTVTVGQSVTLKATVTGTGATPTGTVTFYYGTMVLDAGTLSSGAFSFPASTNGLPPGTYPLSVNYSGDANYNAATGTLSAKLSSAPTTTTLTASPTTVTPPASVALTATVKRSASGAIGNPTGTVAFYYGTLQLGSAPLNNGVASYSESTNGVPAGSYGITAKYSGDGSDVASTTSTATTVTVK